MGSLNVLATSQTHLRTQSRAGASNTLDRLPLAPAFAAGTLGLEACFIAALGHPWLPTHSVLTAPITFLAALTFFGRKQLQASRFSASSALAHSFVYGIAHRRGRIAGFLALHVAAAAAMLALCATLTRAHASSQTANLSEVAAWVLSIVLMAGSLVVATVPLRPLAAIARRLGTAWVYATACALLAAAARALGHQAWDASASQLRSTLVNTIANRLAAVTFAGVHTLLGVFYTQTIADPGTRVLGTGPFIVHIAGACSGIEGLGLTFVFAAGWLVYERRHLRLLRAVCLVPLALALMFALNLLRITALVAIGAAGHPTLALTGFHTEAGWIAFTLVAIAFLLAASKVPFFHYASTNTTEQQAPPALTAPPRKSRPLASVSISTLPVLYLLPFVTILATSLFTRAASTGFEALYPLRFLSVVFVLLALRKPLARLSWRVRPADFAAGAAVGLLWLLAVHVYGLSHPLPSSAAAIAHGLARLTPSARAFWLVTRVLAATITVPLAEELAFRGFLARRMAAIRSANPEAFTRVRYATLTLTSILISSVAFGAMHGSLWFAGTLSGIAFACVARHRNSLGAAVAAHATANLVLAIAVLITGNYGLW